MSIQVSVTKFSVFRVICPFTRESIARLTALGGVWVPILEIWVLPYSAAAGLGEALRDLFGFSDPLPLFSVSSPSYLAAQLEEIRRFLAWVQKNERISDAERRRSPFCRKEDRKSYRVEKNLLDAFSALLRVDGSKKSIDLVRDLVSRAELGRIAIADGTIEDPVWLAEILEGKNAENR